MERDYTLVTAAVSIVLADELRALEANADRRAKKRRVLDRKISMLREAYPDQCGEMDRNSAVRDLLGGDQQKPGARHLALISHFPTHLPFTSSVSEMQTPESLDPGAFLLGGCVSTEPALTGALLDRLTHPVHVMRTAGGPSSRRPKLPHGRS